LYYPFSDHGIHPEDLVFLVEKWMKQEVDDVLVIANNAVNTKQEELLNQAK
jgi:hypothetical protein